MARACPVQVGSSPSDAARRSQQKPPERHVVQLAIPANVGQAPKEPVASEAVWRIRFVVVYRQVDDRQTVTYASTGHGVPERRFTPWMRVPWLLRSFCFPQPRAVAERAFGQRSKAQPTGGKVLLTRFL